MNILIVDDSRVVRKIIQNFVEQYFEHSKYKELNLFEASDGDVAIELMKNNKIDILFLDMFMPKMSGEDVIDIIRKNNKWNKTRIIMATAEDSKKNISKLIGKGINGYLVKPLQQEAVLKTLNNITSRMLNYQ